MYQLELCLCQNFDLIQISKGSTDGTEMSDQVNLWFQSVGGTFSLMLHFTSRSATQPKLRRLISSTCFGLGSGTFSHHDAGSSLFRFEILISIEHGILLYVLLSILTLQYNRKDTH